MVALAVASSWAGLSTTTVEMSQLFDSPVVNESYMEPRPHKIFMFGSETKVLRELSTTTLKNNYKTL